MGSQKLARRLGAAAIAVLALVATSYFAALGATTGWPTYQHDAGRSGLDPDAAPVATLSAGWNTQLDGTMYAQPLVVGSLVYAATENNTVYALNVNSGAVVWQQHLSAPARLNQLPCGNIDPYGITGTPVIDTPNGVLYAAALQASPSVHHELYALNLNAGGAVLYHYPIDAPGSDPLAQGQRGALTLANGKVYVPYAGRAGDCGTYKGRVVGVNTGDASGASLVSYGLPNTSRGGIWAAGSADGSGNLYVATGNSNATASTAGPRRKRGQAVADVAGARLLHRSRMVEPQRLGHGHRLDRAHPAAERLDPPERQERHGLPAELRQSWPRGWPVVRSPDMRCRPGGHSLRRLPGT